MKRHADLHLLGVTLRLRSGDQHTRGAAKQWEDVFGVKSQNDEAVFTNARMRFREGVEGMPEGIVEVRIGVEGTETLRNVLETARTEGLQVDESEGSVEMLGVRFMFENVDGKVNSKL